MKIVIFVVVVAALTMIPHTNLQAANADLVVHTNWAPASASQGSSIPVGDVTSNKSSLVQAGASTSYMYLNTNATITGATNIGTHSVGSIGPRGKVTWSNNVPVPTNQPLGTNYFITVCDKPNAVLESNENNNTNFCIIVIGP